MHVERTLRNQGLLFCAISLCVVVAVTLLPPLSTRHELWLSVALIALLGVPHGGFDVFYGGRLFALRNARRWVIFLAAYGAMSILTVLLWRTLPLIFLIAFLLITVVHFSGDPMRGAHVVTRFFYGGAVIVLPNVWHASEVLRLFKFLVPGAADAASLLLLSQTLEWLAWPWLLALVACAVFEARKTVWTACELAAVTMVAVVVTPLLAFATFFCAMHGARHIVRTLEHVDRKSLASLVAAVAVVMLLTAVFAAVALYLLKDTSLDERLMQVVFVGLAALTVPHMTLVERVRFRGWG